MNELLFWIVIWMIYCIKLFNEWLALLNCWIYELLYLIIEWMNCEIDMNE